MNIFVDAWPHLPEQLDLPDRHVELLTYRKSSRLATPCSSGLTALYGDYM